jgi:hexokinase
VRLHSIADPDLDSGGTNLRIGFIEIFDSAESSNPDHREDIHAQNGNVSRVRRVLEKKWSIGEVMKKAIGEDLFGWIGKCMVGVMRDASEAWPGQLLDPVPMGVTFSFPMMYVVVSYSKLDNVLTVL